jgi:hypothetical protein
MARLTDPASVLRSLEISRDAARQRADFYVAYAQVLEESRRAQVTQPSAGPGPARAGADAWARVARPEQEWLGHAALASTYRQAAQHAALVDIRWATDLAVRAALAYLDAGMPFGMYLLAGLLDDQILRDSAVLAPGSVTLAPAVLCEPVQLMYLLLAAASRPWLRDELRETVDGAVQRLSAHELHPMGPQSVPLGDYLELATIMLYDDPGPAAPGSPEVRAVARLLAARGRTQFASLRLARRNRYLWERGAAPVNIVDLENVAMYGLVMRHRPWFEELYQAIGNELARDDELTELSVWATDSIATALPSISGSLVGVLRDPEGSDRRGPATHPEAAAEPTRSWRPGGSVAHTDDESAEPAEDDGPEFTDPDTAL